MTIKSIKIKNVRGIDEIEISSPVFHNKPNILVAPNGFGKSSIATAFKNAAHQTSIKMPSRDRHRHNDDALAEIVIELDGTERGSVLSVTETARTNEIRKKFDIHVISDLRRVKAHSRKIGGYSKPEGRIVIDPIEICSVPPSIKSPYKKAEVSRQLGCPKKLVPDLSTTLFCSPTFVLKADHVLQDIKAIRKPRNWSKMEAVAKKAASFLEGENNDVLTSISSLVADCAPLADMLAIAEEASSLSNIDAFLAVYQLGLLTPPGDDSLRSYIKRLRYKELKESLARLLADLGTAWKAARVHERGGKLIVIMPDPEHISNGQRDVLLLACMLHMVRSSDTRKKAILVIDEVFDYLDDANLIVAQYFVSKLISESKLEKREIYVILLTHLDPKFFKNYVFSNQHVIYLNNERPLASPPAMKKMLAARSDPKVSSETRDGIAKYLLHYFPGGFNLSPGLGEIKGCRPTWGEPGRFARYVAEEFGKFNAGLECDPLAICAATRRAVEALAYLQLGDEDDKHAFIESHKTIAKLQFAAARGAVVPEAHYLLRIIFDDGLHWRPERDNLVAIAGKLSNPILKTMIVEAVRAADEAVQVP